jgi:D-alanyl-D-alanine carboxypeptidase (penicillin-binding protein 5/6)
MSRELITKYPKILEYSSIWMENITHVTRQGTSEFGLTNTNKLLRSYEGCVGLKTGSTSIAKYCLSAVAQRNNITLISVIMAAPEPKTRFSDAAALLNYGYAKCSLYIDENPKELPVISVRKGVEEEVSLVYESQFQYLSTDGKAITEVKQKLKAPKEVNAPVKEGEVAGEMIYYTDEKELGSVPVLYGKTVKKATYGDCLGKVAGILLM